MGGVPSLVGVSHPQGRKASVSFPVNTALTPSLFFALSVLTDFNFACATGDLRK